MVDATHVRVCREFENWLKSQRQRTGLNNPDITKILVNKLNGMVITPAPKKGKHGYEPLTIRKVLNTPVEDVFKWL